MVKLTKAITQSVGADLSFLDFPKLCSNSSVRGHSIREPSHPNGNHPSMVMRSAKRWKTRDRTASQNAHQTGMGKRNKRVFRAKIASRELLLSVLSRPGQLGSEDVLEADRSSYRVAARTGCDSSEDFRPVQGPFLSDSQGPLRRDIAYRVQAG